MTHSFISESTYYTQKPWKAESEPAELRVQGVQVHPQILLGIEAKAVLSIDAVITSWTLRFSDYPPAL